MTDAELAEARALLAAMFLHPEYRHLLVNAGFSPDEVALLCAAPRIIKGLLARLEASERANLAAGRVYLSTLDPDEVKSAEALHTALDEWRKACGES